MLSAYFRENRGRRATATFEASLSKVLNNKEVLTKTGKTNREMAREAREKIQAWVEARLMGKDPASVGKDPRPRWSEEVNKLLVQLSIKEQDLPKVRDDINRWIGAFFQPSDPPPGQPRRRYFTTVTLECGGRAALSWYLTRNDRDSIEKALDGPDDVNARKLIKALTEWWDEPAE